MGACATADPSIDPPATIDVPSIEIAGIEVNNPIVLMIDAAAKGWDYVERWNNDPSSILLTGRDASNNAVSQSAPIGHSWFAPGWPTPTKIAQSKVHVSTYPSLLSSFQSVSGKATFELRVYCRNPITNRVQLVTSTPKSFEKPAVSVEVIDAPETDPKSRRAESR